MKPWERIVDSKVEEVFLAVSRRLGSKKRWCSNRAAMNKDFFGVAWSDPDACRWCLTSAIFLEFKKEGIGLDGEVWKNIAYKADNVIEDMITEGTLPPLVIPSGARAAMTYINDKCGYYAVQEFIDRVLNYEEVSE